MNDILLNKLERDVRNFYEYMNRREEYDYITEFRLVNECAGLLYAIENHRDEVERVRKGRTK